MEGNKIIDANKNNYELVIASKDRNGNTFFKDIKNKYDSVIAQNNNKRSFKRFNGRQQNNGCQ